MTSRIITGLVLTALVIAGVGFGPYFVLAPVIGAALLLALYEFLRLPGTDMKKSDLIAGVLSGVVLLATAAIVPGDDLATLVVGAVAGLSVALFLKVLFSPQPIEKAGARAMTLVTGLVYVVLLGSFAIMVVRPENGQMGRHVLLLIAVVTWLNDSMAFFGGKFLGRHSLYRIVSPKKTWEGSFFGLLGSVIGVLVVRAVFSIEIDTLPLVLFALIGGALGQVGDLVESVFKRSYGIKDSGAILPGHGGLLDRIDAFLFVVPFGYFWFF